MGVSLQTIRSARHPCRVQGTQSTNLRTEIIYKVQVERKTRTRAKPKLIKITNRRQHAGTTCTIHSKAERTVLVIQYALPHIYNSNQKLYFVGLSKRQTKRQDKTMKATIDANVYDATFH